MRESGPVREEQFISQLNELLGAPVTGLDAAEKARIAIVAAQSVGTGRAGVECRVVPFVPGRRPIDEAAHPGLGSSDQAALVLGATSDESTGNTAYLLVDIASDLQEGLDLDVSLSFEGPDGSIDGGAVPGWDRRPVRPVTFTGGQGWSLGEIDLASPQRHRIALTLSPERDLLPGSAWRWTDVAARLRDAATDGSDPFTFGHMFAQQVHVGIRVMSGGTPVAADQTTLFVCDARRLGSLYHRLIDGLIAPDCRTQAAAAGVPDPGVAFHPWYPVLVIGSDKAALYTRALIGDIVKKRRNLTDPGWLLRVGLHLEFLTCLGIIEAVREDVGDLLSPDERAAFEASRVFDEVRRRINPGGWREVWEQRAIAFRARGSPRAGPVSARNLLCKRRATLAFLRVHHMDLRQAIELAGPNDHNAQETWQRVFRDAERAVLRTTPAAFPELGFLPGQARAFVLWHRSGQIGAVGGLPLQRQILKLLGDQDGLFASACVEYRSSMNAVAAWAKRGALMDYTGNECIPVEVSLMETRIARPSQLSLLQRRDGYQESLEVSVELPEEYERPVQEVERLLAAVPAFASLAADELHELARTARQLSLGPTERVIVQGQDGSSLFVLADGALEILLRTERGIDLGVATLSTGAIVGEMSLLTGEPRSATVRAITNARVFEIGRQQYEPILQARPELLDALVAVVEQRRLARGEMLRSASLEQARAALRTRIGRFLLGEAGLETADRSLANRPRRASGR